MENSNNEECPTGTLIDLNEDDFMPSYLSDKKGHNSSHSEEAMTWVQMENKGKESVPKEEKYESIMDMSPTSLNYECNKPDIFADSKQVSGGAEDDCPTALLIDLPSSSSTRSKQSSLLTSNKRNSQQEESLVKYRSDQDAKLKEYCCIGKKSASGDSDNPLKNELSPPRIHWKAPSPQSMSCISKEASKVIYDLNSSLLEDDSLLFEEIMPIPINFNLDENSDEDTLITNAETCSGDNLLTQESSASIQTEEDIISSEISKIALKSSSSDAFISPNYNSLAQSSVEKFDSKLEGKKDSNECSTTSESLQLSSEIKSISLDNSEVFLSDGETTIFIENNLRSEDKEKKVQSEDKEKKVQSEDKEKKVRSEDKENGKILPIETIIKGSKATPKNSASLKEIEKRPTLRNVSNIKNVNSRCVPKPGINKMNFAPNPKELQTQGKQQLKKTTSAEPQKPKGISRTSSFQYGSKRESVSSFQQPKCIKPKPSSLSEYKSPSSDVKPSFTEMKTPSKRYSIATPLGNRSIKKSTLTPASSRIQNPPILRVPQSASGNRLSFSKSWQQPTKSSSKGFKNQNTTCRSSTVEKPSFCGTYSSKEKKKDLNQSISLLPSQISKGNSLSTTSKKRFCSKLNLPSPLPAEQDTKLARALFPSKSFK